MIERVAAHQEDPRQLLVVAGHHGRTRGFLGHRQEVVNVFDRAEGLLPQLQLNRRIELREAGIEMVLKRVGVGEVDGMGLVRVFADIRKVKSQSLTQTTEFDLALVFQAELERLLGNLLEGNNVTVQYLSNLSIPDRLSPVAHCSSASPATFGSSPIKI